MRVEFTPFAFADLLDLDLQPAHKRYADLILGQMLTLKPLMEGPYSWSGWTAYGRLAACAGILPNGDAWALFSGDMKREFVPITRKSIEMMQAFPGTVRADIDETSREAVRWAKLVGFERTEQPGVWVFNAKGETSAAIS